MSKLKHTVVCAEFELHTNMNLLVKMASSQSSCTHFIERNTALKKVTRTVLNEPLLDRTERCWFEVSRNGATMLKVNPCKPHTNGREKGDPCIC